MLAVALWPSSQTIDPEIEAHTGIGLSGGVGAWDQVADGDLAAVTDGAVGVAGEGEAAGGPVGAGLLLDDDRAALGVGEGAGDGTNPGQGYPRQWADQARWNGGWELDRKGRLRLKAGGQLKKLLTIFSNPDLPAIDDYYEPFTYDYETLVDAPLGDRDPVARPHSQLTGKPMDVTWGPNWDEGLAGGPEHAPDDPHLRGIEEQVRLTYEQAFMFFLPRICEHCLNPSCVASCPSGAMYKREEDGIVLVDQDRCRGWRYCVSGCPYKKVYFNHRTGKAEKCTLCYPRIEIGQPTICSETCVGRIRYLGLVLYDADRVEAAASVPDERDLLAAQRDVFLDPEDPEVRAAAQRDGIPRRLDRGRAALADLRPRDALGRRAAAAPGVPHAADGLVRAAALAGRLDAWRPTATRPTPTTSSARSTTCVSRSSTSPTC